MHTMKLHMWKKKKTEITSSSSSYWKENEYGIK